MSIDLILWLLILQGVANLLVIATVRRLQRRVDRLSRWLAAEVRQ